MYVVLCDRRRPVDFRYAPLATEVVAAQYVAKGQKETRALQQSELLFDHPVSASEQ